MVELIAAAVGSTAAGALATQGGRWAIQRLRHSEGEATRVWTRLEAEERKRAALETDVEALRTERHELLSQLVEVQREASRARHEYAAELHRSRVAISEALEAHQRCEAELARVTDRLVDVEARLRAHEETMAPRQRERLRSLHPRSGGDE